MSTQKTRVLKRLSTEMTGDPSAFERLIGCPLSAFPDTCWLWPSHGKLRIDSRQVSIRNWLWEALGQPALGTTHHLEHLSLCTFKDCVNPKHQVRVIGGQRGRKVGQAPGQRTRSIVDVGWPDPSTVLMLLALGTRAWPEEYRDKCWIWTGPVVEVHLHRMPKMNGQTAHKAVWELFNRKTLPSGTKIKKLCRNEMCVNPTHMFIKPTALEARLNAVDQHELKPAHTPVMAPPTDEEITDDIMHLLSVPRTQSELHPIFTRWLLNQPELTFLREPLRTVAHRESWLSQLLIDIGVMVSPKTEP